MPAFVDYPINLRIDAGVDNAVVTVHFSRSIDDEDMIALAAPPSKLSDMPRRRKSAMAKMKITDSDAVLNWGFSSKFSQTGT